MKVRTLTDLATSMPGSQKPRFVQARPCRSDQGRGRRRRVRAATPIASARSDRPELPLSRRYFATPLGLQQRTRPPGLNTTVDPEARRVRTQGTLWLAMALCEVRALSLSYQHENLRNILRLAPPDSQVGGWTSSILTSAGMSKASRGSTLRCTGLSLCN
jgi:hypothetical protein